MQTAEPWCLCIDAGRSCLWVGAAGQHIHVLTKPLVCSAGSFQGLAAHQIVHACAGVVQALAPMGLPAKVLRLWVHVSTCLSVGHPHMCSRHCCPLTSSCAAQGHHARLIIIIISPASICLQASPASAVDLPSRSSMWPLEVMASMSARVDMLVFVGAACLICLTYPKLYVQVSCRGLSWPHPCHLLYPAGTA